MIKILGFKDSIPQDGVVIVNTTSRSKDWSRGLSPFFLGPVKLYGEYKSLNVENAWQFSKVYDKFIGKDSNPTEEYFKWAELYVEELETIFFVMRSISGAVYNVVGDNV